MHLWTSRKHVNLLSLSCSMIFILYIYFLQITPKFILNESKIKEIDLKPVSRKLSYFHAVELFLRLFHLSTTYQIIYVNSHEFIKMFFFILHSVKTLCFWFLYRDDLIITKLPTNYNNWMFIPKIPTLL